MDGAKNVPLGPSRFLGTRILLCRLGPAILAPGCSDAPPGSADALPAPQESSARYSGPVSEERVQELMALGYLEVAPEKAEPGEEIVSDYDPERSFPGYNLVSHRSLATGELLDAHGNPAHSWSPPGVKHFSNVELQPNGDLLLSGVATTERTGYLARLSFDGEVIFFERIGSHHDSDVTPDGSSQRLPNGNTLIANSDHGEAIEVTRSGDIVWRFRNPNVNSEGYRSTIVRIKRYPVDWIQPLLKKP